MKTSSIRLWLAGLLRHRSVALVATIGGIAIAVSLITTLGTFLTASEATMSARAQATIATDWQVEVQHGADPATVLAALRQLPGDAAVEPVQFGTASGFTATIGGTTQATGSGVVLGLSPSYMQTFPAQMRQLSGHPDGVQVAQQTASNLQIKPGDSVTIGLAGRPPVTLTVAGVVDMPQANSLFQRVGASAQSQPSAPPDNVVVVPATTFARVFAGSPDGVTTQFHVSRNAILPADPAGAYVSVTAAARHFEASVAGAAIVGDNLGAALGAARSDAAYAGILFLFLGVPGVLLAAFLTAAVVGAGAARRRSEQALLRTRGFSRRGVIRLAVGETVLVTLAGAVLGVGIAFALSRSLLGVVLTGSLGGLAAWAATGVGVGLVIAITTTLVPIVREARSLRILDARRTGDPASIARRPWWLRTYMDLIPLAAAGAVFWASSSNNYSLVLAPEGVPTISVSYWAFFAPALLWAGGAGLLTRVSLFALERGYRPLQLLLRPLAGRLSPGGAASLSRRRPAMARAIVLLALALSFAASTAVFNATYAQQAEAAAQLTNGADVTVTRVAGTSTADLTGKLANLHGVKHVEPMMHRFAYVGADLQDLYGVRPGSIADVTALQDAYFTGGTAKDVLQRLSTQPSSILVSAETVKDYQLKLGDTIRLRLPDPHTGTPTPYPFTFAGIVNKFPTAPKDSFFVANATYIAQITGDASVDTFLVDTGGRNQPAVAGAARTAVGTVATVTDITSARGKVGSSLTSVSLDGLTRIELGYAILLAIAAGGLVFALGVAERRRSFAILSILGASRRQLRGLIVGEGLILTVGGVAGGVVMGSALAAMLVKVLTGVFDPPPSALAVPGAYLTATVLAVACAIGAVAVLSARASKRPPVEELRDL